VATFRYIVPVTRLRLLLERLGIWPKGGARGVGRLIGHAALVGVLAGIGAIVFHLLCVTVQHLALEQAARYTPGGPRHEKEYHQIFGGQTRHATGGQRADGATAGAGDGARTGADAAATAEPSSPILPRLWALILVPVAGGLLSGWLVARFAPEARGHGTDSAISAFHHQRGDIRARVPLVKMFASAITLGTGGAGGREGPISQIGAGIGSLLAGVLKLSDRERRLLMTAGLGAGIGAIFHAPLAGALFAVEVLYRDADVEAEALMPAFIANTVAYCVYCLAFGFQTLFTIPTGLTFDNPLLLLPLTVLAMFMTLAAWAYVRTLFATEHFFDQLKLPRVVKTAIGAGLTGALGVLLFLAFRPAGGKAQHDVLSVMSIGYGYLQEVIHPSDVSAMSILLLLAVGVGKIVATSLTIGSGGSAGTFGPCMVIGATLGTVVGLFFHNVAPGLVDKQHVPIFAILGMVGFFSAAANTPISALLIVSEVTSSYTLLLPAMWVCAIGYILGRGFTLYSAQLPTRRDSPAHRHEFIIDLLKGQRIQAVLDQVKRQFVTVRRDTPLSEIHELITTTTQTSFPIVDEAHIYHGVFDLQDVRRYLYEQLLGDLTVAQDLSSSDGDLLTPDMDLSEAMSMFAQSKFEELPVVDSPVTKKVVGMLRRRDVIEAYDRRLVEMRAGVA
jgi:CIC family chloride channel protein